MDAAGLSLVTAGDVADETVARFKEQHDNEGALYLQGLSDRAAEDLTEYVHNLLRQRTGRKGKVGQRYSPGYPALTDLMNNRVIYKILGGEDIGVSLTDANEFSPTSTTACVICFHPEAGYT